MPLSLQANDSPKSTAREENDWRNLLKTTTSVDYIARSTITDLVELLGDMSAPARIRKQAAFLLARTGSRGMPAVAVLARQLESADKRSAEWICKALARFGPLAADSTQAVIRRYDASETLSERLACLEVFATIGTADSSAIATLQRVLREGSPTLNAYESERLQAAAAESLGLIGDGAAATTPWLIRASQHPSPLIRRRSVEALGRFGAVASAAVPVVFDLLVHDVDAAVRDAAATTLGAIGGSAESLLVRLAIDTTADPSARHRAIDALGRMNPGKAARDSLTHLLDDPSIDTRLIAAAAFVRSTGRCREAIPSMLAGLRHSDRQTRMKAVRLGEVISNAPPNAADLKLLRSELERACGDDDVRARRAARKALRAFTPTK